MTIRVTKPAIDIREKLAELDKRTGVAGEAMLQANTAKDQQELLGVGRKNILINPNFDIWQRGDSVTGPNGYFAGADRWQGYSYAANSSTITRQTFAFDDRSLDAPAHNFMRVTSTNKHPYFRQTIERPWIYSGRKLTLSLWAKSNTHVRLNPGIVVFHNTGIVYAKEVTISSKDNTGWWDITDKWEKYTITFEIPDLSSFSFSATQKMAIEFAATINAVGELDIAQAQLELGSVATPFEIRSIAEEMALCERYYQIHYLNDTAYIRYTASFFYGQVAWRQRMRAAPTVTFDYSDGRFYASGNGSVMGTNGSNVMGLQASNEYGAQTYINTAANISNPTNPSGFARQYYIYADAELF